MAGLLQVQDIANDFGIHTAIKSEAIKVPAAGAPQTILLIGSDHRAGTSFKTANTDTMLLVRLDGSSSTINVMSLPRDLEVDIPGHGTDKLNAAYSDGRWNLLIKTIQQNVFPQFVPNHILDVNFGGFADLVDAIGVRLLRRRPSLLQPVLGAGHRGQLLLDRHRARLPAAVRR